jgi:hypothetical protein
VAAEAVGDAAHLGSLTGLRWSFVIHATGGLACSRLTLVLSIYEAKGTHPLERADALTGLWASGPAHV